MCFSVLAPPPYTDATLLCPALTLADLNAVDAMYMARAASLDDVLAQKPLAGSLVVFCCGLCSVPHMPCQRHSPERPRAVARVDPHRTWLGLPAREPGAHQLLGMLAFFFNLFIFVLV